MNLTPFVCHEVRWKRIVRSAPYALEFVRIVNQALQFAAERCEHRVATDFLLKEHFTRHVGEGLLFCAPSVCDPALLDQPMVARAVERAGVPWTAFKYSENSGQFQVIREQAGTFADSIKLWSNA